MSSAVSRREPAPADREFKRKLGIAIDLKNQKRYGEAAHALEELRETYPQSASVHGLLGHALWEQNELEKAVQAFRRAVKLSPESELASLGLFHTLMETGNRRGAFQEMDRFRRVADSAEYKAIAKKTTGVSPKFRYAYVDNSSVFIEGQRVSAVAKGMAPDIDAARRREVRNVDWRLDFGKLHKLLFGEKYEVGRAMLWGRPGLDDSFWKMVKGKGWQVKIDESSSGNGKAVEVAMAYQVGKDAALMDKATSEIILVTGDRDLAPVVLDLAGEGALVTVAFWSHAAAELRDAAAFVPLDKWLSAISY
jgi:tetratricopeptide (TPR) repeat protein